MLGGEEIKEKGEETWKETKRVCGVGFWVFK